MYESPVVKRMRAATQDAADDADFTDRLIAAIETNPDVRTAILRLLAAAPKPRQPRPTTTQPVRRGRGR